MGIRRSRKFDGTDKPKPKPSTLDMEIAVAELINPRVNLIVPNISWGMFRYELDLLVVTKNRIAWEIEIKVSKSDLKKDAEKSHNHRNEKIQKLFFAIPEHLKDCIGLIPSHAGVIIVHGYEWGFRAKIERHPKIANDYKWSDKDIANLYRLASMRTWSLKKKIQKMKDIVHDRQQGEEARHDRRS